MAKPTDIEGLGPRTRLSDAGPKILAARTADVRSLEAEVARKMGGDAVHDMRVASRRCGRRSACLETSGCCDWSARSNDCRTLSARCGMLSSN